MEFLPAFDFLKDVVPDHTPCEYHEEMNTKSGVVPLPVLLKDEDRYIDSLLYSKKLAAVKLNCAFTI